MHQWSPVSLCSHANSDDVPYWQTLASSITYHTYFPTAASDWHIYVCMLSLLACKQRPLGVHWSSAGFNRWEHFYFISFHLILAVFISYILYTFAYHKFPSDCWEPINSAGCSEWGNLSVGHRKTDGIEQGRTSELIKVLTTRCHCCIWASDTV